MIFCVTGPMAAGKNAASDILEKMNFACVDADVLTHEAIEIQKKKILEAFSSKAEELKIDLLDAEGKINRRNLGKLLFTDSKLIKQQEEIVYPEVNRLFDAFILQNPGKNIVINATLLYKVPLINRVDTVIFIDCPVLKRYFRARKRDKLPSKQIWQRFKSQRNLFAKYKNSVADTRRVWNTGSRRSLEKKLQLILSDRQGI